MSVTQKHADLFNGGYFKNPYPANTSTLIFGWKWKLSRRTFIDVVSTLAKLNYVELCQFNVDEPSLFQRWNLFENESWADVCLSTLFQRWKNYVDLMLLTQCCFIVDIWLKRKIESKYDDRRWENSIETTLSIFVVLMFTRKWRNNKTKLSFQVKIVYFFYIRT